MTDIDKLEALRAKATQGPFEYSEPPPGYSSGFISFTVQWEGKPLRGKFPANRADDEYTVALLNAAPDLIAEIRQLRERYGKNASLIEWLDCRFTGAGFADLTGTHCPPDRPCQRCRTDAELERLRTIEEVASKFEVEHFHGDGLWVWDELLAALAAKGEA